MNNSDKIIFSIALIGFTSWLAYSSDALKYFGKVAESQYNDRNPATIVTKDGEAAPLFKTLEDAKSSRRTNK